MSLTRMKALEAGRRQEFGIGAKDLVDELHRLQHTRLKVLAIDQPHDVSHYIAFLQLHASWIRKSMQ